MKKKTAFLIILFSNLSMGGIIWLQVEWIKKASELKQEQFNNHVEISLWWVSEQLEMELSKDGNTVMAELDSAVFHRKIASKVDSLVTISLTWFDLKEMDYSLIILPNTDSIAAFTWQGNSYRSAAAKQLKDKGLEFRLTFHDKDQWVSSQLRFFIISSVVLILFVLGCFILTLRTLWQQKKIFETISDFITNLTHEFKTPLTNVGFASSLLNKIKAVSSSPRASKLNHIIRDENQRLQHHVEQILNLARLEKGELPLNKMPFNIHDALEESILAMELQISSRKGRINKTFLAETQLMEGDKIHIIHAFTNLIDNANKYSLDEPEISISTFNKGNGIMVTVEDKGIGVSRDKQKLVFDKFYRVPTGNLHNAKGFGLGLSYAKMVVVAHNGNIGLKSEQGKGSCFEIFLPLPL